MFAGRSIAAESGGHKCRCRLRDDERLSYSIVQTLTPRVECDRDKAPAAYRRRKDVAEHSEQHLSDSEHSTVGGHHLDRHQPLAYCLTPEAELNKMVKEKQKNT